MNAQAPILGGTLHGAAPQGRGQRLRVRHGRHGWTWVTVAIAGFIALPVLVVLLHVMVPAEADLLAQLWPLARALPPAGERVQLIVRDAPAAPPRAGHGYLIWTGKPGWCGATGHCVRWRCDAGMRCAWELDLGGQARTSACASEAAPPS